MGSSLHLRWGFLLTWAVVANLLLVGCSKDRALSEHKKRTQALIIELGQLGLTIDPGSVRIEIKTAAQARNDLGELQDKALRPSHFKGVFVLQQALGLNYAANPAQLRARAMQSYAENLAAYYHQHRRSLVFLDNDLSKIADLDLTIAHELVHAFQDRHSGGIEHLLAGNTLEQSEVKRCLVEGHASLIALAVILRRTGRSLDGIQATDLDMSAGRMISGEALQINYEAGQKHLLRAFQNGEWSLADKKWPTVPTSSEQVLHAEKNGRDLPRAVDLPAWPESAPEAVTVHDDVLGELMIFSLLAEMGISRSDAFLIATGWDGDRWRVFQTVESGSWAAMWRTVWDRESDAIEFERLLHRTHMLGHRQGLVVNAAYATEADLMAAVLNQLKATTPAVQIDESDVASTEAVETRWHAEQARGPRVIHDRWLHKNLGVSLQVPPGWTEEEFRGTKTLMAQQVDGMRDNIMVLSTPNPQGLSLEHIEKQSREMLSQMGLRVLNSEIMPLRGKQIVFYSWQGTVPGNSNSVRGVGLGFLRDSAHITVAGTMNADGTEANFELISKTILGIQFLDPR